MKHNLFVVLLVLLSAVVSNATLTIHLQSPYRDDAVKGNESVYTYHITGEVTSWNADFGKTSNTRMTPEGDHWYSYTWNKTVADYPNGGGFKINVCSDTASASTTYNNKCEMWDLSDGMSFKSMFNNEVEIWLYTDGTSYTASFVAPGSKMVWFKSPWGNKVLPQMIFGQDTILMRFVPDDKSSCGWFYGAISPAAMKANPLKSAHFVRNRTPYMSVPAAGTLDLSDALDAFDTVYVDGTSGDLTPTAAMGTLGTCFDSTRVLHVYHPWRNNSTFKDSLLYISVGSNIVNNPTAMERDSYPFWFSYEFSPAVAASQDWKSTMAVVNFYRRQNEWPQVTFFSEAQRPLIASLFPQGVYEAWIHTRSNGAYDVLYSPLEPKVVRLMSPWDNMSPAMIVADDTVKMGPIAANAYDSTQSDTCGWYQGTYFKHTDDWSVHFKQSFGMEYYALEGLMGEGGGMGSAISLDSMMALYDTVWVYPYPLSSSAPKFSEVFPGRLGICPTMKISAMLLDWAGESYDDAIDIDFGGIYGGNAYTTIVQGTKEYKTCGGHVLGMVQETLSPDGLPLRVDSLIFPWDQCSAGREIDKWFIPEVVAVGPDGKEYTNATCRDIDLKLDAEGFWLADVTESPNGCNDPINPGFYPLDDFEYLDSAKTIKNPKFDWDVQGCKHNYSFSMKISAQFKYVKGQYFEFRGDDDVWVFINNRLVVDIGGCHSPVEGAVDLDTLGLVEGTEYPFQIFFSERNATGSNFKMRTSINLQTQKTYFPVQKYNPNGVIEYELKQLLIDESLSCDVSSVTKVDTAYAQTVFKLVGGRLPTEGILLEPGLNYGGIWISENMSAFTVDTTAFVNSRLLDPGTYVLICYLASDQSQYQMITFVVPEYPLPDIAFVDVFTPSDSLLLLDPEGLTLRGTVLGADGGKNDTLLAHVTYPDTVPLKIVLLFGSRPCGNMDEGSSVNCTVNLNLYTNDPIGFLGVDKQRITEISTDSLGYAQFYVVGDSAVNEGSFVIYGNGVANELIWRNIHFKEPPVPFVTTAQMFDVTGDGIVDSLVIPFSKPFKDVVPDTLSWNFGGSTFYNINGMENVWPLVLLDSVVTLYNPEGLKPDVFTGVADKKYEGTLRYHYTYIDEDSGDEVKLDMNTSIEDKVAPVILSAVIENRSSDMSVVVISMSEGSDHAGLNTNDLFEFYRDSAYFNDSLLITGVAFNKQENVVSVFFNRTPQGTLPAVGDYVRLTPGTLKDRSGNAAHLNNPRVRIVGEQRTELAVPGVVTINGETPWPYEDPIVPISVPSNKTIKEITDSLGLPGLLLGFNIGELATTMIMNLPSGANRDSALALVRIVWDGYYFSHIGNFVNEAHGIIACNDRTVFYNAENPEKSNCYDNPGNIFFEWNARSENGRLVGTGAYITKTKVRIYSGNEKAGDTEDTYTLGIKRSK